MRHAIHAPEGLILVVGPEGSGRRTALRSMLGEIDPAQAGRLVLPKAIATPAIAQRAVRAALAGRRAFSTMALSRACGAISELRRLGVTTEQLIDALALVICQRLLRRLCPDCSMPDDREPARRALAGALNTWLSRTTVRVRQAAPTGCARCGGTGYLGLTLAYELIEVDVRARALIASNLDPVELERALLADGRTIWDRGLQRLADGETSFDALRRAVRSLR